MLSPLEIKMTFVSKQSIDEVLYKYKTKMNMDMVDCENQRQRNGLAIAYRQKIFTKLNTIFRRQILLDGEEAIKFYSENSDVLDERINLFFDIIDYINDELNIGFIPDRLFTCAYLRIDTDTYDTMLNDIRADISANLKSQIKNLESFVISMTMNGIENGVVNGYAWKKMQLKSKFGGNEIQSVESQTFKANGILLTNGEEVKKRMNTSYNFPELLEDKKDNNNS